MVHGFTPLSPVVHASQETFSTRSYIAWTTSMILSCFPLSAARGVRLHLNRSRRTILVLPVTVAIKFVYISRICSFSRRCNQLPLLLNPTKDNSPHKRSLYDVSDGVVSCEISIAHPLYRFIDSSLGRLFTVDESMVITLVNLFLNKVYIPSPCALPGRPRLRLFYAKDCYCPAPAQMNINLTSYYSFKEDRPT